MTSRTKFDYETLKREYIYSAESPPISYTDLADKHGMSRSLIADRGTKEGWYEQRVEFRKNLGIKTTEAMTDQITKYQMATRQKMMDVALTYLDQYEKALKGGEIKVSTRDMVQIAAMLRTLVGDAINNAAGEEGLIDPDTVELTPDALRRGLAQLDAGTADERPDEDDPAEEPAQATRPN